MIPRIENAIVAALEARICAAIPETAPGAEGEPETFVTTIETRQFTPCVQAGGNYTLYGEVEAEISVVLYSQRARYDYSALMADFAKKPVIHVLGDQVVMTIDRCESVEGPHLTNDAWSIKVKYHIYDIDESQDWQEPIVGAETMGEYDICPKPQPYQPHEPEVHFNK